VMMGDRQALIADLRECASDPGTKPQTYLGDMCSRAADALDGATLEDAYAEGRADQLDDDRRLLGWAYGKLARIEWTKQEDALAMDEIKLILLAELPHA
jgi:hypothetical protein